LVIGCKCERWTEEVLLSKYIAEPALLQDLRDAFYDLQKKATEFVLSEVEAILGLLNDFHNIKEKRVIRVEVPLKYVKRSLKKGMHRSSSFQELEEVKVLIADSAKIMYKNIIC